jgi:SAM-dependent methyltransferase
MPRLIPRYVNTSPLGERLRVGTFGFRFGDKGFARLVEKVQEEFDEADILIHAPDNDLVGATEGVLEQCQASVRKPGIKVFVNTKFGSARVVLDFLASNHLNVFLYDVHKDRGISSCVEKAIAVGRPVAVNRCGMFRHVHDATPSICVEERSLKEIMEAGVAPLVRYRSEWAEPAFIKAMEGLFDRIRGLDQPVATAPAAESAAAAPVPPAPVSGPASEPARSPAPVATAAFEPLPVRSGPVAPVYPAMQQPPATRPPTPVAAQPVATAPWPPPVAPGAGAPGRLNRVLDDQARAHYRPVIDELFRIAPTMMARKIPAANIQQAFVLDAVRKELLGKASPRVLCVGSFEDTAAAGVKASGYALEEIDPALNWDLDQFFRRPETRKGSYDVIFSTSVIEHVKDDETFVAQIAELLAPGGLAVITCDFNDAYRPGDRVPQEDFRFYTSRDLGQRLLSRMKGCVLADAPAWSHGPPDFSYAGIPYMFAALVARKTGDGAATRSGVTTTAPAQSRLRVNRAPAPLT